jgi:hypothetical protein
VRTRSNLTFPQNNKKNLTFRRYNQTARTSSFLYFQKYSVSIRSVRCAWRVCHVFARIAVAVAPWFQVRPATFYDVRSSCAPFRSAGGSRSMGGLAKGSDGATADRADVDGSLTIQHDTFHATDMRSFGRDRHESGAAAWHNSGHFFF